MAQQLWYQSDEAETVTLPRPAAPTGKAAVLAAARESAADPLAPSAALHPVSARRTAYLAELERELASLTGEVRAYVLREVADRLASSQTAFEELGEDRQTAWESAMASLGTPAEVAKKFLPQTITADQTIQKPHTGRVVLQSAVVGGIVGLIILACSFGGFHDTPSLLDAVELFVAAAFTFAGAGLLGWQHGKANHQASLLSARFWGSFFLSSLTAFLVPAIVSQTYSHFRYEYMPDRNELIANALVYGMCVLSPGLLATLMAVRAHRTNRRWPLYALCALLLIPCVVAAGFSLISSSIQEPASDYLIAFLPAAAGAAIGANGAGHVRKRLARRRARPAITPEIG